MLLDSFVPVLVVDPAQLRVRERFVGVCDLDEFLGYGLIAWILVRVVFFRQAPVGALDVAVGGVAVDVEELEMLESRDMGRTWEKRYLVIILCCKS